MLKAMRKNVKSLAPTLWFVIVAFIISIFAVWGGSGKLGFSGQKNTVVTIGKKKISSDFYYQSLRWKIEQLQQEYRELDSTFIRQLNIPNQVLEQIIQQEILEQTARRMGITVSDEEIKEKIITHPNLQRDGKFIGYEEYKNLLEYSRISVPEFEKNLADQIKLEKVRNIITSGISVTPEEVWENYKKNNESAKIEYILNTTDKIDLKSEPSLADLKEYFNQNKADYKIPEKRQADYVFFSTEEAIEKIEVTESEIEKYYNDNASQFEEPETIRISRIFLTTQYKEPDQVKAETASLLERIRGGEDFGLLANTYSEDEKSKENGDWGLYDWKRLSVEEQDIIETLEQDQVSDVIEVEGGFAILKVTEKQPPKQKPLIEVRDQITSTLKDQKAREEIDDKIGQLEKRAHKEKSLDAAAQKTGLQLRTTPLLKKAESLTDIDPSGSVSLALFQMEEKDISPPIYTYKGVGLAQLQKIEAPRQAEFDEVRDEIKEAFIEKKKKEKALENMENILAELSTNSMDALSKKYDLEYNSVDEHKRGQYLSIIGENADVDALAFSLPLLEPSRPVPHEDGYLILRVLDRKEVTKEDLDKEKTEVVNSLLNTKKNKFYLSYYMKLREETGIVQNYGLIFQINNDVLSRFEKE